MLRDPRPHAVRARPANAARIASAVEPTGLRWLIVYVTIVPLTRAVQWANSGVQ